ncbi:hypothetical protein YC2023_071144 [Brassica napus]
MKTVRADEFASRHSEDSIRSMAAISDEQMSFLLSTINQIDEGQNFMLQFVNSSSKNLKIVQLFKVYDDIGDYRTSSHPYKIGFFHATFVAEPNDFPSEVPEKYLADYTEISGNIVTGE